MTSRNTITVTVYGRNIEHQWAFPARWIICPRCEGHATTTSHIEPDGGGFTATEWADACDDDPDFEQDYFSGRYDEPCPACEGKGRVWTIDEDTIIDRGGWRETVMYRAYVAQEKDSAEIDAMQEAERRMGA